MLDSLVLFIIHIHKHIIYRLASRKVNKFKSKKTRKKLQDSQT